MINTTNIIIPKRYRKYIDKVYREDLADSKSPDGATYWIDLKECCEVNGIHLAPFDFKEDLLNWLKKINVITSEEEYVFKFGNNINKYRNDFSRLNRINNKSLKKYLSNLNSDDIDLDNKLVNLYEDGSLNIYYKELQDGDKDIIEDFIKEHAIKYIEYIRNLTEECYNYGCCEYDDWSAGLYNCDGLYLNAIKDEYWSLLNIY